MNKFAKTLLIALVMLAMPAKQWGQTVKNGNIEIELNTISNPDYRYCLLSKITNDHNVSYIIDEDASSILLFPRDDWDDQQFQAYFDDVRAQANHNFEAYTTADKEVRGVMFTSWKEQLPQDIFVLLFKQLLIENPPRRDGNQTCATADPFCTTDVVSFYIDASVSGSCETGPDYGCMSPYTSRPPYWFYMKIGVAGTFTIQITNSGNNDLDFCAWGPFSDPVTPCTSQLTSNKIIDCDSPYNSVQECTIPATSQVGQYYLLVITRYSSGSTTVTFSKVPGSGPGETDCGILPPLVDNDGPYCVGDVIHLTANGQAGATYSWTGPGGFTSNQQNPTRPNCTMAMAGTYTCTISLGGQTNSATTEVVVYPKPTANFTATSVCKGEPTQFTSTSTTNPAGQQITSYHWNFGDGQTSTQQNPTHTYAQAGPYQVTLTVACGNGLCTNSKTQTVTVNAAPAANAGPDQTIPYNTTAQLSGSGGAGSFSFHWEPANKVVNPNSQNTQTVVLTQDQTYTLTVTNTQGQCVDTDEVTIHIAGGALTVTAVATPSSICYGGSTQLVANAGGGSGTSTYSWSPATGLSATNIYNPIASPTETTTYTCTVTNAATNQTATATVTVIVNAIIEENVYHTICPDDVYLWHGTPYTSIGTYQFDTVTDQGCDKTIYLHLDHYPVYDETVINAAICEGESYMFYGVPYTSSISTFYTDHTTVHGCDSIVRLNLTVWPENDIADHPVSLCPEQLPYYYEHDPNQIPLYEGLHIFHLNDIHGCDSTVWVDIEVSDYYIPPVQTEYVCYAAGETPTYTWNPIGSFVFDLHETDFYTDTLPTSNCDGIFRLDLHFMQTPEVEHTYVDDACDRYYWPVSGQWYNASGEYEHHVPMTPFPCNQEYRLHLTLYNSHTDAELQFNNECDEVPFTWFGDNPHIIENGTYNFSEGTTTHGCDTAMRVVVSNMRYTPNPTPIRCTDANAVVFGDTIAVVTETEFFSFNYDFYVMEQGRSLWDECEWSISKPSWRIEQQFGVDRKSSTCKVYVADRDNNLVELSCKVRNSCMDAGEYKTFKFYLKSSYVGVDEFEADGGTVSIVPNPNGGRMELRFENMEGRVGVKVFDMKGNLVDAFETFVSPDQPSHEYNMKRYADGLYLFVISDSQRTATRKVVITH